MSLYQIGVLLQLFGFLLAGLFIAVLKIDTLQKWTGRIRQTIVTRARPPTLSHNKGDEENMFSKGELLGCLFVIFLFIALDRLFKAIDSFKQKKISTIAVGILQFVIWLAWDIPFYLIASIFLLLFLQISDFFKWVVQLLADRMRDRPYVTDSMILFGSVVIFIGLLLQTIAAFKTS